MPSVGWTSAPSRPSSGLARVVGPEQRPVLTGPDREGHLLKERPAVAYDMGVLGAQHDRRHRSALFTADSTARTDAARAEES
ncbi:hypothetical protein GCM10010270_63160 [Streptomyces violaceus]|nr:hypothetical protein GCM10010270_63160 [Streptomyces janthinus]